MSLSKIERDIRIASSPYRLAPFIKKSKINSDTFLLRIPLLLDISLRTIFEDWLKTRQEERLLYVLGNDNLGLGLRDISHIPFIYYYGVLFEQAGYPLDIVLNIIDHRDPEFESRLVTQITSHFLRRINGYQIPESDDFTELAGILTAIQIPSTNLLTSPNYAYVLVNLLMPQRRSYEEFYSLYLNYRDLFLRERKDDKDLHLNIYRSFLNHFISYISGYESGFKVPENLLKSFFNILRYEDDEIFGINEENFKALISELEKNPNFYCEDNLKAQFYIRYFLGLKRVAEEVVAGNFNGNLYLTDHIKRVMEAHNLWPDKPDELTEEEWQEKLYQCLQYPEFFNFLTSDEKVREVVGRYDYRGLVNYLKSDGKKSLSIISLGFGKLGVASWELIELLRGQDIEISDFFGVDLLNLSRIDEKKSDQYSITRYRRDEDGALIDLDEKGEIDMDQLTPEEVSEIISWYNDLFTHNRLIGGVDLTSPNALDNLDLPLADLVTLQGTIGCISDLSKRIEMIKNALRLVNPNGGILLIEGGMTFYGSQNVNSIALRLNNGRIEILYVNITRTKNLKKPVRYCQRNMSLLVNRDIVFSNKNENGPGYFLASFTDNKELIPALYNAISRN